jgi:hypothetical protein
LFAVIVTRFHFLGQPSFSFASSFVVFMHGKPRSFVSQTSQIEIVNSLT